MADDASSVEEWRALREKLSSRERRRVGGLVWRGRGGSTEPDARLVLARARYELGRLWIWSLLGPPIVFAVYVLLKGLFEGWKEASQELWLPGAVATFYGIWYPISTRKRLERAEAESLALLQNSGPAKDNPRSASSEQ